jgi:hypothetical protein
MNAFSGAGLEGFEGVAEPGTAINTPGAANLIQP